MTNRSLGRWLLVALAIVGLAFAAPVVSAHGDGPTQGNETAADRVSADGEAKDWAVWMEVHMTDHLAPNGVDVMKSYKGVTVEEMSQDMTDGNYTTGEIHEQGYGY